MSMSMHVIGLKPVDEKWLKFKAIWDACESAKVKVPKEIVDFFDDCYPRDDTGIEVDIDFKKYNDDMREGFDVDISTLPKDVKIIRFYCSW